MNAVKNRHGSAVVTLPSETEIVITRSFDAPAALLFRAYTEPDLVKRWWGFEHDEWKVCDIDLRVGGTWRYVATHIGDDASFDVAFNGEYLEIDAPHRLVSTEMYEGYEDPTAQPTVNTLTFDEADGVTTMTTHMDCHTREIRDAIIESGMEHGMQISMDRLDDVARELAV